MSKAKHGRGGELDPAILEAYPALRKQVRPEPYAGGRVVRVRVTEAYAGRVEIELTCTHDEVATITAWAKAHVGRVAVTPMPVPEHRQRPWGPEYRWTRAAHEIVSTYEAAQRVRVTSGGAS